MEAELLITVVMWQCYCAIGAITGSSDLVQ